MSEFQAWENEKMMKRSLCLSFSLSELCNYEEIHIKSSKVTSSPSVTACGWMDVDTRWTWILSPLAGPLADGTLSTGIHLKDTI